MDEITLARFMSKVWIKRNGCWEWQGTITDDGYGAFCLEGANRLAHRVAYLHWAREIPDGLQLDHLCHTRDLTCTGGKNDLHRRCVSWRHLEAVSPLENSLRSARARATECIHGHEYTVENTYYQPAGGRACRTCRADQMRAWLAVHHPGVRHGTETHCPQLHPYAGDNLIMTSNGARACRRCKRDWNRSYARIKRAVEHGYLLIPAGYLLCPLGHDLAETAFPYKRQEACLACVGAPELDGRSREIKEGGMLEAAAPVLLSDGPGGMPF